MMYCQNCGQQYEGNFCPNCGAPKATNQSFSQNEHPTNIPAPPSRESKPLTSKWWFWVLLVVTVAVIAAMLFQTPRIKEQAIESAPETTQQDAKEQQTETTKNPGSLAGGAAISQPTEQPKEKPANITLEETVLIDQEGIRVTATGFSVDEWMGPQVSVLIENNSNRNVIVQTRYAAANGAMIASFMSSEVMAGKKANDEITFYEADLEMAGIKTIQTIELVLTVLDNTSYETLFQTDPIVLETSAPKEPQLFDDNGLLMLEQGGFRMVAMGVSKVDSFIGKDIVVFMQNNTGREITVQLRNVSLNGYMLDPIFSADIADGKIAYNTITFMSEDLETNGIEEIQTLECSILVYDSATWDDIILSNPILINFPF